MSTLTHKRLLEVLYYDPEAGYFMWKVATSFRTHPGAIAGTVGVNGRVYIGIDGHSYLAHRLAWFCLRRRWPRHEIDHRDLDPANNIWANLRRATRGENQQHAGTLAQPNSSTGKRGVYRRKKRWCAKINVDRQQFHLGTFSTKRQAHAAYLAAKPKHHPFAELV